MKVRKIRKILRTYSPNVLVDGKPLLFWTLKYPKCVALLLVHGADPNIKMKLADDYHVTPLYFLNKIKKPRRETVWLLEKYGGEYTRYSDYITINIKA